MPRPLRHCHQPQLCRYSQYSHNFTTFSEKPQVYKVGIYDWRKRCLYFFILLLMILINLTSTQSFMKACMLFLQSSRNISVNIVNSNNQMLTQLITGSSGFKARGKMFEVKPTSGKLLFSADEQKVVVGGERLSVMGAEEEVFSKSVETPHVRADPKVRVLQNCWKTISGNYLLKLIKRMPF
uniref:Sarcoglycan, delta (Dystrophin-associated glycoprotein) n=1 Tax=Nothobranchius furzeri TaxID=105023 RepID=A0A8C6PN65_NOTFU